MRFERRSTRSRQAASDRAAFRRRPLNNWECLEILGGCLAQHRTEPLRHLARGPLCVGQLAKELSLEAKTVSKQLRIMLEIGLLECDHRGTEHIYRLSPRAVVKRVGEDIHMTLSFGQVSIRLFVLDRHSDLSARSDPLTVLAAPNHKPPPPPSAPRR